MARTVTKEAADENSRYTTLRPTHGWLYGLLAVLSLIIVFMAGAAIANHHRLYRTDKLSGGGFRPMAMHVGEFGGGFGGSKTQNGQTRTSGVVTNVNGSNFTLAGHGSSTNVSTSGSTQYRGGNQVKQNDSVIIVGSTSNGVLNATEVWINP